MQVISVKAIRINYWWTVFAFLGLVALTMAGCSADQDVRQAADAEVASVPDESIEAVSGVTQPFDGELKVYSAEPVFQKGLDRTWDQAVVDVGAVLFHDGLFHLFYNGTQNFSILRGGSYDVAFQRSSVGYAVSANGYDWYRMTDAPILTLDGSGLSIFNARVSSVLRLEGGTWVMYLYSQNNDSVDPPSAIWRASAPAPEGPWQLDASPVLETGSARTWDGYAVRFPEVVKTDDDFVMYYVGISDRIGFGRGLMMMGMATSVDGISWTKYDDEATGEGEYRESDPVFSLASSTWGQNSLRIQRVWRTTEGWGMIYSASENFFTTQLFGYATSPDGLAWTPLTDAPILVPDQVHGVSGFGFADMLYLNGKYYMYFNATKDEFSGDIYLATTK